MQFEEVTPDFVAEKAEVLQGLANTLDDLMLSQFDDFSDYTALFYGFFSAENKT